VPVYPGALRKLISLAGIYNRPTEQLLRTMYPDEHQPQILKQVFCAPNATMLFDEGPLDEPARYLVPDTLGIDQPPDETTLLSAKNRVNAPYRRGIIGKRDLTLDPMIPAGSIVQIDTRKRAISSQKSKVLKSWAHEFKQPIYFRMTGDHYYCGWCELDKDSDWLTLVPHPLSPASSRRWRYRKEIENLGRVTFVAIRLAQ
jgi:hypothetical protein